jgi:hypothetical protein
MHRLSLSKALLLIALIAANLAALKALNPKAEIPGTHPLLLAALLPLANAQIVSFYFLARRYRLIVRRRPHRFNTAIFCIVNLLALVTLFTVCIAAPEMVAVWIFAPLEPPAKKLGAMGYGPQLESAAAETFLIPAICGVILSGPALSLGLAVGWLLGGYEVVISRVRPERGESH